MDHAARIFVDAYFRCVANFHVGELRLAIVRLNPLDEGHERNDLCSRRYKLSGPHLALSHSAVIRRLDFCVTKVHLRRIERRFLRMLVSDELQVLRFQHRLGAPLGFRRVFVAAEQGFCLLQICLATRELGGKALVIGDGLRLGQAAQKTPVVDGSGLKNTLEREAVEYLERDLGIPLRGKRVLMVSALDRFGMAQALVAAGADVIFGDFIFALDLDRPVRGLDEFEEMARKYLPDACKLPFQFFYPTGKKQDRPPQPKYPEYYDDADIIAGDFHFMRQYMPARLDGKMVLTNTLTATEVRRLYRAMVETLADAIKHRGSSLADEQYRDLFGEVGDFQGSHQVYDREGQACRRCRNVIVRVKTGGRSTFFCEHCQV